MGSNTTTVTAGALAGAVASIMWWAISEFSAVEAPEAVVAASVVIFTALIQFIAKGGEK